MKLGLMRVQCIGGKEEERSSQEKKTPCAIFFQKGIDFYLVIVFLLPIFISALGHMKHYLLLSIFICLWGSPSYAQLVEPPVFEWAESLGGPGTEGVSDWIISSDGSIYLTGSYLYWLRFGDTIKTVSPWTNFQHDAYVMKLGPDLKVDWVKSIGGVENDSGIGLEFDHDGNLWWSGNFKRNIIVDGDTLLSHEYGTNPIGLSGKAFCIKVNHETGQIETTLAFGGFINTEISDFTITPSGEFIFLGVVYNSPGFVIDQDTLVMEFEEVLSGFLLQFNPQTSEKILSLFLSPDPGSLTLSLARQNHNGNLHIVGAASNELWFRDSLVYEGDFRTFHMVVGKNSIPKLFETFPRITIFHQILFDRWGNNYLLGEIPLIDPNEVSEFPFLDGMSRGVLIRKSAPNGLLREWINFPGRGTSFVGGLVEGENLIVAGTYTDSLLVNGVALKPPTNSVNKRDAFIAKIDHQRKTIWVRTAGGEYGEAFLDIKELTDRKYVVMGYMETAFTYLDTFLLSQPFVQPFELDHFLGVLSKDTSGLPLPVISNEEETRFTLFPNPSSGDITLFGEWGEESWAFSVYSLLGTLIDQRHEATINGQTRVNLDFSHLSPGHYYLKVQTHNYQQIIPFITN